MLTTEGKEYLTSQQLISEIKDELYISGGRVNTEDLAKRLNVDLFQINLNVSEIVREEKVQLVGGCLFAEYYFETIAQEINVKLQIQGQISVGDLTLQFDLPVDLLQHGVLKKYLGKIIHGIQDPSDPKVFYTEGYITRTKAKIRGALMGLLKPTSVRTILTHLNLSEGLFLYLFDQLNDTGVITGRQCIFRSLYEPSCYKKSKNRWLIGFYKLNNYLEYYTLTEFEIYDHKEYLKTILPDEDMIFLQGCAMNSQVTQRLENALQECIVSKSYLDVSSFLNTELYPEDIERFIDPVLKNYRNSIILFDKTVLSNQFIETLKQVCLPMTKKNVEFVEEQLAESEGQHTPLDHKAERCEEHRKKASSSSEIRGKITREHKSKSVKKYLKSKKVNQDSNFINAPSVKKTPTHLEIIHIEHIESTIKDKLENEGLDNFVTQIAEYIQGDLNQTALEIAKDLADKLLQDASQNRKFIHASAQDRINVLINNIKLYEKGLKLFPSDQQPQFIKYLLKSFGGDVLSEFCKYAANQCNLSVQADVLSLEQTNNIINDLSEEYMKPLQILNSVLTEDNMEQFFQAVDVCLLESNMILKQIDKQDNRLLVQNHRGKLISEIEKCKEPALVLHLVVSVLFIDVFQHMLHASGRQVSLIIPFLKSQLKEEDFDKVQKYNEMVAQYLTAADEEKESIDEKLKEDLPSLRCIVTDVKKYK